MSILSFPGKLVCVMEKSRSNSYPGKPRATAEGGGGWKEEETSRTVTLWPGALVNQTPLSGCRTIFFCFFHSLLWYKNKTQNEEKQNIGGTNSNHKWRKMELSKLSPIIYLQQNNFLQLPD